MEGEKYIVYVKELNPINQKRKCVFRELRREESIILN